MIYLLWFCFITLCLMAMYQIYVSYKNDGLLETIIYIAVCIATVCTWHLVEYTLGFQIPEILLGFITVVLVMKIIKRVMKRVKEDGE